MVPRHRYKTLMSACMSGDPSNSFYPCEARTARDSLIILPRRSLGAFFGRATRPEQMAHLFGSRVLLPGSLIDLGIELR